jgi:pimeloyl-ACP methyl ester carboxylesterase
MTNMVILVITILGDHVKATRSAVELGWGRVSYLSWSPVGEQPHSTVLLLHGGGVDNSSLSWAGVGGRLADAGYRVIAPDHPGYGQSRQAPWSHSQERLVEYVGELIDALAIDRYVIGGLSLGAGMAIGHVLDRPGSARGAVLLGSYGLMDRLLDGAASGPAQLLTWLMLRSGLLAATTRSYGRSRKRMERGMRDIIRNPVERTPELMDEIMAATEGTPALASFEQWQRDQVRWNRLRTNYLAHLGSFSAPALLIHGDRDSGVPIRHARLAAERMPDAKLLVVPDAGHWVQRDRPDLVVPAMIDFLNRLDGAPDAAASRP